jgi:hypothetical protein
MTSLRCRSIIGLGIIVVALAPAVRVDAVSQPTFNVQIIAPECTLDTIDDGLGPVQVITCPPGTVDPTPPDPVNGSSGTGSLGNGGDSQSAANPQVSQRFQSSADTFTLLETLKDLGVTLNLPKNSGLPFNKPDVAVIPHPAPDVEQNVLISTAVVSGAVGAVIVLLNVLHLSGTAIGSVSTSHLSRAVRYKKPKKP